MKRFWKKPAVRIAVAAVAVVALALLGLWISSLRASPAITFDFLNGHPAMARIERYAGSSHYKDIMEVYSFQDYYEDVCGDAYAELLGLGFIPIGSGRTSSSAKQYLLVGTTSRVKAVVTVFNKRKCVSSSSQRPVHSSRYGYESEFVDGWVTVEVRRWPLRLWPPQHLVHGLKMRFQAINRPPPPPAPVPVRQTPQSDYFIAP